MYKKDDHNSFMMLGLVNTLKNKGSITEEERKDILNLGEFIEEWNQITKAKEILANLNERLKKGKF